MGSHPGTLERQLVRGSSHGALGPVPPLGSAGLLGYWVSPSPLPPPAPGPGAVGSKPGPALDWARDAPAQLLQRACVSACAWHLEDALAASSFITSCFPPHLHLLPLLASPPRVQVDLCDWPFDLPFPSFFSQPLFVFLTTHPLLTQLSLRSHDNPSLLCNPLPTKHR